MLQMGKSSLRILERFSNEEDIVCLFLFRLFNANIDSFFSCYFVERTMLNLVGNSQCQNSICYLSVLQFSSRFGRSIRNESDCCLPHIGTPNKQITKPCVRANYQFKHHV